MCGKYCGSKTTVKPNNKEYEARRENSHTREEASLRPMRGKPLPGGHAPATRRGAASTRPASDFTLRLTEARKKALGEPVPGQTSPFPDYPSSKHRTTQSEIRGNHRLLIQNPLCSCGVGPRVPWRSAGEVGSPRDIASVKQADTSRSSRQRPPARSPTRRSLRPGGRAYGPEGQEA